MAPSTIWLANVLPWGIRERKRSFQVYVDPSQDGAEIDNKSISRSPEFRPVSRIRVRGKSNFLLSFEGCQALCEHLVDRGIGIAA